METVFAVALVALCTAVCINSQEIELRLSNESLGDHIGRVEVLYNGTWGAICSSDWNWPDGRVACRQMGFITVVCALPMPMFGGYLNSTPVWMSNVRCRGRERSLEQCSFNGFGVDDCDEIGGGVICASRNVVGPTVNVTQVSASSTTVTVGYTIPLIPANIVSLRFLISVDGDVTYAHVLYDEQQTRYQTLIGDLTVNTTYSVTVRTDVKYTFCTSGWLYGNDSEAINITTNSESEKSTLPIRLVPPLENADFMGRLEVMYNGTWGTVCDDYFGTPEANVVCRALNFTRALCSVNRGRMGHGSGPIWLDNVDCERSHEVLEDCDSNDWGVNNCQHDDDVGVICLSGAHTGSVMGVSAPDAAATTVTVTWNAFMFPPGAVAGRYRIRYRARNQRSTTVVVRSSETMYTIERLQVNVTYLIDVRVEYRFRYCGQFAFGRYSDAVSATTVEQAPSAPPTSFHVVVLNSTAIELQWHLPLERYRNGVIRGYKLFIQQQGTALENVINVGDNSTLEYIVSGLTPNTAYSCSMLAYTIADGPRTIHLTVVTMTDDFIPFIVRFGVNGDGFDQAVKWTNQTDVHVHCGSGIEDVSISWFFQNGTEITAVDRNVRQGSYSNGTNVLQVASSRLLSYCDAGVYTCVATTSLGSVQRRNFTLMISDAPPEPGIPFQVQAGTTWVTLAWVDLECDGGHTITGFNIRYRKEDQQYVLVSYMYDYNVNAARRNYTLLNLEPGTAYRVSLQALSAEFKSSAYSTENILETLPPAPDPPRHVTAVLLSQLNSIVRVSWREPAVSNGGITHYTVYGSRLQDNQRDTLSLNVPLSAAIVQRYRYTGPYGVANISVPVPSYYYVFQVSASNNVNGVENEGNRSAVTVNSTVFVPLAGLPVPQNVTVTHRANTSIGLSWNYPPPPFDAILRFRVTYSGIVEWRSPRGNLVMFEDMGASTTTLTTIVVSQLIPSTTYSFRVSAITESGEGKEQFVTVQTAEATEGRIAYFQLLISPVKDCLDWASDSAGKIDAVESAVLQQLSQQSCPACTFKEGAIDGSEVTCREGLTSYINYRARIRGTGNYSVGGLVALLQQWVQTGTASIAIDSTRLFLSAQCNVALDSPTAHGCLLDTEMQPTESSPSMVTVQASKSSFSSPQIGGLVVGVIIALLLLLFIFLVIILIFRASKLGVKELKEDKTPFANAEVVKELCEDSEAPKESSLL